MVLSEYWKWLEEIFFWNNIIFEYAHLPQKDIEKKMSKVRTQKKNIYIFILWAKPIAFKLQQGSLTCQKFIALHVQNILSSGRCSELDSVCCFLVLWWSQKYHHIVSRVRKCQEFLFLLGDHPYMTSADFWPFWTSPTHLISINTVLNVI